MRCIETRHTSGIKPLCVIKNIRKEPTETMPHKTRPPAAAAFKQHNTGLPVYRIGTELVQLAVNMKQLTVLGNRLVFVNYSSMTGMARRDRHVWRLRQRIACGDSVTASTLCLVRRIPDGRRIVTVCEIAVTIYIDTGFTCRIVYDVTCNSAFRRRHGQR